MYEADGNPTNLRHCTVEGCRRPFYARSLCQRHYWRVYNRGTTDDPPRRRRGPLPESWRLLRMFRV